MLALQRTEASENCKGCGAELLPISVTLQSQASPVGNSNKTAQAARLTPHEARMRVRDPRRESALLQVRCCCCDDFTFADTDECQVVLRVVRTVLARKFEKKLC